MSGGWNTIESDAVSISQPLQSHTMHMLAPSPFFDTGDVPLVSNLFALIQGVFTFLLNNLGVKDVQFEELIALDADYLRQLGYVTSSRSPFVSPKLSVHACNLAVVSLAQIPGP